MCLPTKSNYLMVFLLLSWILCIKTINTGTSSWIYKYAFVLTNDDRGYIINKVDGRVGGVSFANVSSVLSTGKTFIVLTKNGSIQCANYNSKPTELKPIKFGG